MRSLSINPNSIASFAPQRPKSVEDLVYENRCHWQPTALFKANKARLEASSNQILSKSAARRLKKAINWMVYLSAKRNKKLPDGRIIPNFSISFLTLTLPSKQVHSHAAIKSQVLNNFFTLLRENCGVQNYIWKAEIQRNGNIHFHVTLDKFVHYMRLRKLWNQSLEILGYISRYAAKMSLLSVDEYINYTGAKSEAEIKKAKNAYNYGNKTEWSQPNSTDVHSVKSVENLASYMVKYMAKGMTHDNPTKAEQESANAYKGRIWFCSRSLSRLGNAVVPQVDQANAVFVALKRDSRIFEFANDYVTALFFNLKSIPRAFRRWFREVLISHAIDCRYPFPADFQSIN